MIAVPADVTVAADRAALVAAARREGGLDLLVHNAGELGPSPLAAEVTAFVIVRNAQFGVALAAASAVPLQTPAASLPSVRTK